MGIYDNNISNTSIPFNSTVHSANNNCSRLSLGSNSALNECHNNCGSFTVGSNCRVVTVSNNCGNLNFGSNSKIETITNNCGSISLGSNCKIGSISDNRGRILMGSNSTVDRVERDLGSIVGGNRTQESRVTSDSSIIPNSGSSLVVSGGNNISIINGKVIHQGSGTSIHVEPGFTSVSYCPVTISTPSGTLVHNPVTLSGSNDQCIATAQSMLSKINLNTRGVNINYAGVGSGHANFLEMIQSVTGGASVTEHETSSSSSCDDEELPIPSAPRVEVDDGLCSICMENKTNVAFQCGHVSCHECSTGLRICHICREVIKQRIKLFL